MPSRWLTAVIVLFWLATTGWLFWHDLWPEWRSGEPPPFHIDLVEEVQRGGKMKTSWIVYRDKGDEESAQKVFNAWTWADYHQGDDTFTLHADFKAPYVPKTSQNKDAARESVARGVSGGGGQVVVTRMKSEYRVTRQGQLQSLRADIGGKFSYLELIMIDGEASLWGEVHDEQFFAHYHLSASGTSLQGDLKPVPVSYHGSVLMPLHPVNRIHGLRPGRTWRQALVDPFRDVLPRLAGGVHYLQAHVLEQPQVLERGKDTTTCLVIEYTGEDMSAKTWVEQDSERVQRQEFTLDKVHWVIQRDLPNRRASDK
ncbi:MAG TPA: hypothetical protein VN688_29795 [Gemmataceae bacterium]|nr:hypothetical protein [Gemmataceae bacterium]